MFPHIALVLALAIAGAACGGGASTRAIEAPSPTSDLDAVASNFTDAVQGELDSRLGGGVIELAFGQVIEESGFGRVLLVRVGSIGPDANEGAGVFLLLAFAEAAGRLRGALEPVDYAAFQDPELARAYMRIEDLVSYVDGKITADQLRQRTRFQGA
jgi:hypothetical protein